MSFPDTRQRTDSMSSFEQVSKEDALEDVALDSQTAPAEAPSSSGQAPAEPARELLKKCELPAVGAAKKAAPAPAPPPATAALASVLGFFGGGEEEEEEAATGAAAADKTSEEDDYDAVAAFEAGVTEMVADAASAADEVRRSAVVGSGQAGAEGRCRGCAVRPVTATPTMSLPSSPAPPHTPALRLTRNRAPSLAGGPQAAARRRRSKGEPGQPGARAHLLVVHPGPGKTRRRRRRPTRRPRRVCGGPVGGGGGAGAGGGGDGAGVLFMPGKRSWGARGGGGRLSRMSRCRRAGLGVR